MREKKYFLISCFAFVVLMMGLAGCSTDKESATNPNGVSAPAPETPQNTTYDVSRSGTSLILGGVDTQTGAPDPLCGLDITVRSQDYPYPVLVDAVVELRWNVSDYPNREICVSGTGTTYSLSGGVYHVYATTNGSGVAQFRVAGFYTADASCGDAEGDATTPRKVRLFVDGDEQFISGGWCNVSTADYNAVDGVNSADLSEFLGDAYWNCSSYNSRSDFDGNGVVNAVDQVKLQSIISGSGSDASCGY
jgi:hypothetical protein